MVHIQKNKILKKMASALHPARGRPERKQFSVGGRPVSGKMPPEPAERQEKSQDTLGKDLARNTAHLKTLFHVPDSSDVVFRDIESSVPRLKMTVAYIEGLSDFDKLHRCVLQPLMLLSPIRKKDRRDDISYIESALLPNGQVERVATFDHAVSVLVMGDTLILVEGHDVALTVETKGWEHRAVGEAMVERVVRGPQQGFVEVLRTNTSLIRSILQTPDLVVENLDVGKTAKTNCALLYLESIANPKIVAEARRRVVALDVSEVLSSGEIEQLIESAHSLLPTILSTERPDRVAKFLLQGTVALLVNGDPFCLVAPVTFLTFIQSPEDTTVRWPYGNVLRVIRYMSLLLTVFLPGLYVAIVNYHPEMVPTSLMMTIAATREPIPFPLWLEVLVMYFGFELIREAGIRIPSPIGPTIGIVGALLIGDAAVSASVVSPILVIVIAVTAVASFTLPNLEIAMFTRVATLVFVVVGAFLGLLGVVAVAYMMLAHSFTLMSLGVPFMSPTAPSRPDAAQEGFVAPPWKVENRPRYMRPRNVRRLGRRARLWDFGETVEDGQDETES